MSEKQELEKYYNNYFSMFRSEGWKQLCAELKSNANNINSVEETKNGDDLYFRKGQCNIIANLLNLENMIDNAYQELQEAPEEEEEDEGSS